MRTRLETQLDLFGAGGIASGRASKTGAAPTTVNFTALSDNEILTGIPDAGIPLVFSLIDEAGRRKLQDAVPVLDRLCRLFTGFGIEREVRALRAGRIVELERDKALIRDIYEEISSSS